MDPNELLGLLPALRELRAEYGRAPGYHWLWEKVADGSLPGVRQGRCWCIRRGDLPVVAARFRLARPADAA